MFLKSVDNLSEFCDYTTYWLFLLEKEKATFNASANTYIT